jgi:hypothetical protein
VMWMQRAANAVMPMVYQCCGCRLRVIRQGHVLQLLIASPGKPGVQ